MGTIVPSPPGSQPMDTSSERTGTLLNQTTVIDATGTDLDVTSMATARLTIVPVAYTGTITFYASVDGTNFDVIRGYKQGTTTVATSLAPSSSSTVTIWEFPVAGLKKLRVITSGSSSGTSIAITGRCSPIPSVEPIGVTLSSAVLAAGTAVIGSAMIQSVSGTALGADVSNTELKVSNYGKNSAAGDTAILTDTFGNIGVSPYPPGATPLTAASGNVAAATAAATLAKATSKTTYITGFEVTGAGATGAAVVSVTVVGTLGGTLTYTYAAVAGATLINTPLIVQFPIPIPSSATNVDIVVSCPTLGTGNLNNTVVAHGYRL